MRINDAIMFSIKRFTINCNIFRIKLSTELYDYQLKFLIAVYQSGDLLLDMQLKTPTLCDDP